MPRNPPPLLAVVLRHLREHAGWTQVRLERERGLSRGSVCRLESGDQSLDRSHLDRLAAILEVPEGGVDRAIAALGQFTRPEPPHDSPAALTPAEHRAVEACATRLSREIAGRSRNRVGSDLRARRWKADRVAAAEAWSRLRRVPAEDRRPLVHAVDAYRTWAMVERLCEESARAASNDVDEARQLAQLARRAASLTKGSESWRSWLEGYAVAFEANAWCAAGEFRHSLLVFSASDTLMETGAAVEPVPLDRARPLILRAVLLIYQGQLDPALARLDEALSITHAPLMKARVHIWRASVLKRKLQFGEAIKALVEARQCAEISGDTRLRWAIAFNEATYLCEAGEPSEASSRLDDLRTAALELGRTLDLVRLRWLTARIAAASGELSEASSALQEVWEVFAERKLWLDAALAVLELASIELERGRTREVRVLATTAVPVFAAQTLPDELLAAIQIFWEAARKEAASAQTAQQLIRELRRARGAEMEAP